LTNAYDEIAYPSACFRQTHPDRLAAHALLLGLTPAPIEACRVLEIGAGDGSNLAPVALVYPEARFVGFDLAAEPVRRGIESIDALGLRNIRLFQADILDVDRDGDLGDEPFDYIVAQGVYSWVPGGVRDALMRLVRRRLAPGGVAYVSYNALPGDYVRLAIRHDLLFAVRDIPGRTARVEAAMRRLQAWPPASAKQTSFQRALAEEAAVMRRRSAASLAHDELADVYHPVYLSDFADHCARNDLQIIAEADPVDFGDWIVAPDAPGTNEHDVVGRAQQNDVAQIRFFRQSLLAPAGAKVRRRLEADVIGGMHVSSHARRGTGRRIECDGGISFDLNDPPLVAVLERLAALWPTTAPVASLGLDESRLMALPWLYSHNAVEFHAAPSRFVTAPGERPAASPLARMQAARGETRLTTLRHTMADVDDEFSRGFVATLDGTRTRAEIARDIAPHFNLAPEAAVGPLGVLLDILARTPLLVQ
jgi:SAM-dependent methyltransferase